MHQITFNYSWQSILYYQRKRVLSRYFNGTSSFREIIIQVIEMTDVVVDLIVTVFYHRSSILFTEDPAHCNRTRKAQGVTHAVRRTKAKERDSKTTQP